jgi:ABC-type nitrate/sulfonate/bicarbonate transport system substrate-binding protein
MQCNVLCSCAAYCSGAVDGAAMLVGGTAAVDAKTGAVGKYTVAAQVKAEEHTLALVLADNLVGSSVLFTSHILCVQMVKTALHFSLFVQIVLSKHQ